MTLEINFLAKETSVSNRPIADRRLYFTADRSALVEEGDTRGAFLACAPGDPIPELAGEKAAPKAEDKAAEPAENKAAAPAPNKGKKK